MSSPLNISKHGRNAIYSSRYCNFLDIDNHHVLNARKVLVDVVNIGLQRATTATLDLDHLDIGTLRQKRAQRHLVHHAWADGAHRVHVFACQVAHTHGRHGSSTVAADEVDAHRGQQQTLLSIVDAGAAPLKAAHIEPKPIPREITDSRPIETTSAVTMGYLQI